MLVLGLCQKLWWVHRWTFWALLILLCPKNVQKLYLMRQSAAPGRGLWPAPPPLLLLRVRDRHRRHLLLAAQQWIGRSHADDGAVLQQVRVGVGIWNLSYRSFWLVATGLVIRCCGKSRKFRPSNGAARQLVAVLSPPQNWQFRLPTKRHEHFDPGKHLSDLHLIQ